MELRSKTLPTYVDKSLRRQVLRYGDSCGVGEVAIAPATQINRRTLLRAFAGAASLCVARGVQAESSAPGRALLASPRDYRKLLATLRAGDTLRLEAGRYLDGLPLHELTGTPASPITIEGPRDGTAVLLGRKGHNTVSIVDSAHVRIRDLTLNGDGVPVDAVKAEGHARFAHHITLERLVIVGYGRDQSLVGISTKCPAWNWIVRGNRIVRAGTGMYFGNSDGTAPFYAGLIEGNVVEHPIGYCVQIKHQHARPEIESALRGRFDTVIRGNRLLKGQGGARDEFARPNLLIGHFPLQGAGAGDRYLIYRNLFFDNPTEALFQGEGNVALYNNLFVNPHGDAVRIQPHQHRPRWVAAFQNSIWALRIGILVEGGEEGYARHVTQNLIAAGSPIQGEAAGDNRVVPFEQADAMFVKATADIGQLDLTPVERTPPARPVLAPELRSLPDAAVDFLGRGRTVAGPGACLPNLGGVSERCA